MCVLMHAFICVSVIGSRHEADSESVLCLTQYCLYYSMAIRISSSLTPVQKFTALFCTVSDLHCWHVNPPKCMQLWAELQLLMWQLLHQKKKKEKKKSQQSYMNNWADHIRHYRADINKQKALTCRQRVSWKFPLCCHWVHSHAYTAINGYVLITGKWKACEFG